VERGGGGTPFGRVRAESWEDEVVKWRFIYFARPALPEFSTLQHVISVY